MVVSHCFPHFKCTCCILCVLGCIFRAGVSVFPYVLCFVGLCRRIWRVVRFSGIFCCLLGYFCRLCGYLLLCSCALYHVMFAMCLMRVCRKRFSFTFCVLFNSFVCSAYINVDLIIAAHSCMRSFLESLCSGSVCFWFPRILVLLFRVDVLLLYFDPHACLSFPQSLFHCFGCWSCRRVPVVLDLVVVLPS